MGFYHIWHKNSIGHYYVPHRPHGIIFGPMHPQSFRKEMNNIVYLLNSYVHFPRVFVEFVTLLTKIWSQNIDFTITAKCCGEGCNSEGCFLPPFPFTCTMQFKLLFFITNHIVRIFYP